MCPSMQIHLPTLSLADAERRLVELALVIAGSPSEAAPLLGTTRHATKRRIIKHNISWPGTVSTTVFVGDGVKLDVDSTTGLVVDSLNLTTAERLLIERALKQGGSIIEASKLLDTTRHAVKRRIIKHGIKWQSVHPAHAHVRMGGGL